MVMDAMFEFLFWLAVAFMVRQAVITSDMEEKKSKSFNKKGPERADEK